MKSCELDPIPTSLLKMHIEVLAPIICNITNSFDTGIFSDELKDALVRPLHKHQSLELELKNFRPVSNLSYLGKIIERLAVDKLYNIQIQLDRWRNVSLHIKKTSLLRQHY